MSEESSNGTNQETSSYSGRPTLITRMVGATRHIMTLATVAVFLGATVLLFQGIFEMAGAVWYELFGTADEAAHDVSLRVAVIEAVDVILVATVLFVIAFGLYQLFVDPGLRRVLPPWLRIRSIGSLEVRMAGMVITVLAIIALTQALDPSSDVAGRQLGFQIAAVIAALSLFLYQEGKNERSDHEKDD